MEDLLRKLKTEVPEFYEYEEFDNILYVDFGRLGTYLISLIEIAKKII